LKDFSDPVPKTEGYNKAHLFESTQWMDPQTKEEDVFPSLVRQSFVHVVAYPWCCEHNSSLKTLLEAEQNRVAPVPSKKREEKDFETQEDVISSFMWRVYSVANEHITLVLFFSFVFGKMLFFCLTNGLLVFVERKKTCINNWKRQRRRFFLNVTYF
jgi:hypothetical protein